MSVPPSQIGSPCQAPRRWAEIFLVQTVRLDAIGCGAEVLTTMYTQQRSLCLRGECLQYQPFFRLRVSTSLGCPQANVE